ncbi:DNA glycosylase [Parasitella parasitica]|nr:DNA glycosylase [Parasitella parasitica]
MSVRRSPRKTHVAAVAKDEMSSITNVKRPIKQDPDAAFASIKKTKIQAVKKEENPGHGTLLSNRKDTMEPPPNWSIVYDLLEALRQREKAPVDTMGCERLAEKTAAPIVQRFQTLVALMLSSQTKDTVTSVTVRKLQAELPGGLCLQDILDIDVMTLNSMIAKVGFHTKKASYLKRTAEILRDQYNGDIPDNIDSLTSLPGVGPKMGYLTLQVAWNKNMGIGVDVHVHRICNRLGWVKTSTPEKTRESLESWLPKDKWRSINPIMVGYGQIVCLPRGPRCDICPVSQYCPSSEVKKVVKKIKKVESVYFKDKEL